MSEKNLFDSISDEIKAKLKECRTKEELEKVLAETGLKLDEDLLQTVAGGFGHDDLLAGICKLDFCRIFSSRP